MAYIYDLSDAWNAAGTTFTAIKMNVTDTASAAASLLMDLQVGGSSRFNVRRDGVLFINAASQPVNIGGSYGLQVASGTLDFSVATSPVAQMRDTGWCVSALQFGRSTGYLTMLQQDGTTTHTLAQRSSTAAQTFNLYGTYTDASNYRRLTKTMSTAGVAVIKPEGAGTGATGNVLHISGLPTANPGPGILWNNAGTPAIGT